MKKTIAKIATLAVGSALALSLMTSCTVNLHSYEDGKSAYEIAVENGFEGNESAWVDSFAQRSVSDIQISYEADEYGRVYTLFIISYTDGTSTVNKVITPDGVVDDAVLASVLANGGNALLGADVATSDNVFMYGGSLDGAGYTIDGSDFAGDVNICLITTTGGKVSNVNLYGGPRGIGTGSTGKYHMSEDLVLDKVVVDGGTYAINIGGGNGYMLYAYDSEFYGWSSYSGLALATFEGCTFGQGDTDYSYMRIYDDTVFSGCTFEEGFKLGVNASGIPEGEQLHITVDNCYYGDTLITPENFYELLAKHGDLDAETLRTCQVIIDGEHASFCTCNL